MESGLDNVSTDIHSTDTPTTQTNILSKPVSNHSKLDLSSLVQDVDDDSTSDSPEEESSIVLDPEIEQVPLKEQQELLAQTEKMLNRICSHQPTIPIEIPATTYDKNIFENLPERDKKPYRFEELIAHIEKNPHLIDLINLDVLENSVKIRNFAITVLLLRCSGMPTIGYQPATGTKRVDINKPTKNGQTLLQMACKQGQLNMAQLLIDAGGDVLTTDKQTGNTALHLGFLHGDEALIEYLLNTQAQFITTVVNRQYETPIDILLKNTNFPEMRALMINIKLAYKLHQSENTLNCEQTKIFKNTLLILERFFYEMDLRQSSTTYTAR